MPKRKSKPKEGKDGKQTGNSKLFSTSSGKKVGFVDEENDDAEEKDKESDGEEIEIEGEDVFNEAADVEEEDASPVERDRGEDTVSP